MSPACRAASGVVRLARKRVLEYRCAGRHFFRRQTTLQCGSDAAIVRIKFKRTFEVAPRLQPPAIVQFEFPEQRQQPRILRREFARPNEAISRRGSFAPPVTKPPQQPKPLEIQRQKPPGLLEVIDGAFLPAQFQQSTNMAEEVLALRWKRRNVAIDLQHIADQVDAKQPYGGAKIVPEHSQSLVVG